MKFTMSRLRRLYKKGVNLQNYMRKKRGLKHNTTEIIKKSYEARAGMDVTKMRNGEVTEHRRLYSGEIATLIYNLCVPESILEAGVGEGITLSGVADHFQGIGTRICGFDLSPSRVRIARAWLKENGIKGVRLKVGNLLHIPYPANTFDVVYTSHAIEPNGGRERPILKELYRVTKKYLLLFEPGYELAKPQYRKHMDSLCFCKGLKKTAEELGYGVIKYELSKYPVQIENPTMIMVIQKRGD